MKQIINILFMSSLMLLAACTPEEKDLFSDFSSKRMDARLKADKEVLTGAENGWLMEYYPAFGKIYGGYNMLVSFKSDGKVTVSSDLELPTEAVTSTFRLGDDAGPVLSFDTYNRIFHLFSDPSNVFGIGKPGKGMDGDFEFLVLQATPQKVILKGKKTGNEIVMTPLKKETLWSEFLSSVKDMSKKLSGFRKYEYKDGGFNATVSRSYNTLSIEYIEKGNIVTIEAPYRVTDTGLVFYSPLRLNGKTFTGLLYKTSGEGVMLVPIEGGDAVFTPMPTPLNELLISGDWYFSYKGLSTSAAAYWDKAKEALTKANLKLEYAGFTPINAGKIAFYWKATLSDDQGNLVFDCIPKRKDELLIKFAQRGNQVGVEFFQKYSFNYLIYSFSGGAEGKTFKLTADNPHSPSKITMTEIGKPNNTLVLSKEKVLNTFEN